MTTPASPKSFQHHNHEVCLETALKRAEQTCLQQRGRLTPLRRQILEMIWSSHEPVKAYDLLDQLKQVHPSSAPPTVYRALDFLLDAGLIHKIESLNAYLGCGGPDVGHSGQFLICRDCSSVAEINDVDMTKKLRTLAESVQFDIDKMTIEVSGICRRCGNR